MNSKMMADSTLICRQDGMKVSVIPGERRMTSTCAVYLTDTLDKCNPNPGSRCS